MSLTEKTMNIYGVLILKNKIHLNLLILKKDGDKFIWEKSQKIPYNNNVTFKNTTYAICRQKVGVITNFTFLERDLDYPITNLKPYIYRCTMV